MAMDVHGLFLLLFIIDEITRKGFPATIKLAI